MTAEQDPLAGQEAVEADRLAFAASVRDHAAGIREFAAANKVDQIATPEIIISVALVAARLEMLTDPAARRDFELDTLAAMSDPETSAPILTLYRYLNIRPAAPEEMSIVQEKSIKTREIARRLGILEKATAIMMGDLKITLTQQESDFVRSAWMDICAIEDGDPTRQTLADALQAAVERADFSSGLRYILDQLLAIDFTTPTPPAEK